MIVVTDAKRTPGPQEQATLDMFQAATWLAGAEYGPAKAALLGMARKLDNWDAVVMAAQEWAEEKSGRRPNVPLHDGTTYGTYMRALDALGLTPISHAKLEALGENLNRSAGGNAPDAKKDGESTSEPEGTAKPAGKLATITEIRP